MAETIKSKKIFLEGLLNWFKTNKRKFSWRTKKDPYKILIAEKMLQKTSTRNVEKVYDKFIEKYPEPRLLAEASIEDIKEIIKPLGLQTKRARELRSTAVITTRDFDGKIPDNEEIISSMPGIGKYVTNAVLCFAFDKDVAIVDTNVSRIMKRVYGLKVGKDPRRDKETWKVVEKLIPKGKTKNFNWALLDFAAKVCTAKNSKCETCPINNICMYYLDPRRKT